jgi:hypothetical protein
MTADLQLGSFTHAYCFNCKHLADIDKFEWRKNVIVVNEGIELIQLRIICPICQDQHCEGLFPHEVN